MKKMLLVFLLLGAVSLVGVLATRSYLRSQAVSENNTISTGTVEIVLSDDNETAQVAVGGSWGHLESSAGEAIAESEIKVINQGTLNSNHLDLKFEVDGEMELAEHIFFDAASGILLGRSRAITENLVAVLLGSDSTLYRLENPAGITVSSLDGNDGSVPDGKLSLYELHTAGVIRVRPLNEGFPMQAGSQASVWLNAYIDPELEVGGQAVTTTLTFALEQ